MRNIFELIIAGIVGGVFLVVGVPMLVDSYRITQHHLSASGHVIDVSESRGNKGGIMYAPIVEFQTPDQQIHRFVSSYRSSQRPEVGESVFVLYPAERPNSAVVNSVFNLFVFPGIFAGTGFLVLFLVFLLRPIQRYFSHRKANRLRATGRAIQAKMTGTRQNGVIINKIPYYVITAEYLDASTNTLSLFESDGMAYDPQGVCEGRKEVTVYVNPQKPTDYWMDTSFLPTVIS